MKEEILKMMPIILLWYVVSFKISTNKFITLSKDKMAYKTKSIV